MLSPILLEVTWLPSQHGAGSFIPPSQMGMAGWSVLIIFGSSAVRWLANKNAAPRFQKAYRLG